MVYSTGVQIEIIKMVGGDDIPHQDTATKISQTMTLWSNKYD